MALAISEDYKGGEFYAQIGLTRAASKQVINKKYQEILRAHHPDVLASETAETRALRQYELENIYNPLFSILLNKEKRLWYDNIGHLILEEQIRERERERERKEQEDPGKEAREQEQRVREEREKEAREQREREAREKAVREKWEREAREKDERQKKEYEKDEQDWAHKKDEQEWGREGAAWARTRMREQAEEDAYAEAKRRAGDEAGAGAEATPPTLKEGVEMHRQKKGETREESNRKVREAILEHRRRQRIETGTAREGVQQHREGQRSNGGESER